MGVLNTFLILETNSLSLEKLVVLCLFLLKIACFFTSLLHIKIIFSKKKIKTCIVLYINLTQIAFGDPQKKSLR